MGKTERGNRHPGAEYWSKRPLSNRCGAVPGRDTKTITHRLERRIGEREVARALVEHHGAEDEPGAPRCLHCKGPVCTLEGCGDHPEDQELTDGRGWTCSRVCYAALSGKHTKEGE